MEGADEIFAARVIHAGFAANSGVHHGQQGGGRLYHGDAPQPCGGGEASHVAHHATTEGHDQGAPFQMFTPAGVVNPGHGGRGFVGFSRLHQQGTDGEASGPQGFHDVSPIMMKDDGIAHHQHLEPRPVPQPL